MICNPILPGFNPDPCICKKGEDFYLAVSSFEWMPGIPVYHSRDLKHWELLTHVLTDDTEVDLKKLPSAKGIWAPCLTYCKKEDLFYVIYGVMNSMNVRYFDVNNYLITAKNIEGPWSKPVYLHSAGFDASILHDEDGRKYIVSLEWETRDGYEKPGAICLAEYDPKQKKILGYPKRIFRGATDRGCIEGPHLTKHLGKYYLMCAEGGTGYYHSVTMARSASPWGPYEGDPQGPVVTANEARANERHDWDHLKPRYYNPATALQKCGHGSYVELPNGEVYLVHLSSRPFVTEDPDLRKRYRCTLGRETSIQRMRWTKEGWLRLADGGVLAQKLVKEPDLPELQFESRPARDNFDQSVLRNDYYALRIMPDRFASLKQRPGYLRLRGQEAQTSCHLVSLLARKLTAVHARITARMDFHPQVYQHDAGLILYYDPMNFLYLRKYYSETLGQGALEVLQVENGIRNFFPQTRTAVGEEELVLRLTISGRAAFFEWGTDETGLRRIGERFDTSLYSDEYCEYGEFTGAMVGITCADRLMHSHFADFAYFEYLAEENGESI